MVNKAPSIHEARRSPCECFVDEVVIVHEKDGTQKGRLVAPSLVLQVQAKRIKHTF